MDKIKRKQRSQHRRLPTSPLSLARESDIDFEQPIQWNTILSQNFQKRGSYKKRGKASPRAESVFSAQVTLRNEPTLSVEYYSRAVINKRQCHVNIKGAPITLVGGYIGMTEKKSFADQLYCPDAPLAGGLSYSLSCWNFRCDLVGNLRIHPAPHSSGASEFRGFRVFDLPPTFSFLRSSYLDSFNPIYQNAPYDLVFQHI